MCRAQTVSLGWTQSTPSPLVTICIQALPGACLVPGTWAGPQVPREDPNSAWGQMRTEHVRELALVACSAACRELPGVRAPRMGEPISGQVCLRRGSSRVGGWFGGQGAHQVEGSQGAVQRCARLDRGHRTARPWGRLGHLPRVAGMPGRLMGQGFTQATRARRPSRGPSRAGAEQRATEPLLGSHASQQGQVWP